VTCVHVVAREQDAYAYKEQLGPFPTPSARSYRFAAGRFASTRTDRRAARRTGNLPVLNDLTNSASRARHADLCPWRRLCTLSRPAGGALDVTLLKGPDNHWIEDSAAIPGHTRSSRSHIYGAPVNAQRAAYSRASDE